MRAEASRDRLWFAIAVLVAGLQTALGSRLPYLQDYWVTVAIGWWAALAIVRDQRAPASRRGASGDCLAIAGAVITLVPLVWLSSRGLLRFLPICAGACLCGGAYGWRGCLDHRRALLFLALPLVNPPPRVLLDLVAPVSFTAWCTTLADRAVGWTATLEGNLVHVQSGILEVLPGCSGLLGLARLAVLAALVVALFPTTSRQRALLVVSSAVVAFVTNLVRMVVLSHAVMEGDGASFHFWHEGTGATGFALVSTAAAAGAWWCFLRAPFASQRLEHALAEPPAKP